ncbi:MAG: FeoB-associated Cys-rich membrane protein [Gemmatimonas sp.]
MQTIIVVLIVACAGLFIARRVWSTVAKTRAAKSACASCGCGESEEREPLSL